MEQIELAEWTRLRDQDRRLIRRIQQYEIEQAHQARHSVVAPWHDELEDDE